MIYLIRSDESKFFLSDIRNYHVLKTETKNIIFNRLERGDILFHVPYWIKGEHDSKVYKVGYLVNLLRLVYPEKRMNEIYDIVSLQYHMFLTIRRMSSLYNEYNNNLKNGKYDKKG